MWVTKDAWCLLLSLEHRAWYLRYVMVGVPNSAIPFILFIPLQTHPLKLFLRQHKDARKKAGHPSCLGQLSLCSSHRVTELAMHICKQELIDLVPSFYD